MKKKVSMFLVCLTAVALLSSPVLGAAFAKFDGVDGESDDSQHDKWSDLLSVDHNYHFPAPAPDAKKKELPVPTLSPIRLTKVVDKAGIKLAEAVLQGRIFPRVDIELTATYGGIRATYLKYELRNVRITSYQINASGNDEAGPPVEIVDLDWEAIIVTYTEFDDTGSVAGFTEYEYDKTQ